MAISDTSFFSSYQAIIGTSYAKGFEEVYSPTSTLITYIASRQLFLASMSTTEVANGVSVVNAHLSNENTYSTGALNIAKTVNQTLNNFFNNTSFSPSKWSVNPSKRCLIPSVTNGSHTIYK